jgi:acyl-coenzyme A synthetase/AMP-(fatty) acid ligase
MVDEAASRHPEASAVSCDGYEMSYGELATRANGVARALVATGLQPHDRVAVLLGKGLDVPITFYGVLAAGGALVPIDPKCPSEQVIRILRATGATHLVSEPRRRAVVRQALTACPETRQVIGLEADDDLPVDATPWSTVADEATDRPPAVRVIDQDPSYILHTSGSTGTPKLILHTHRSAMSFLEWATAEYSLTREDRLSNHSSHHTCFATFDYYAAARAGATTVILTPAVMMMPSSLAALLENERVTVWYSVPTALVQLSLRGCSSPARHSRTSTSAASCGSCPAPASATFTARPRSMCAPTIISRSRASSKTRYRSVRHALTPARWLLTRTWNRCPTERLENCWSEVAP